jgi:hypothetical protein
MSLVVGGVGSFILLLSVWHVTEALNLLTGMHMVLAVLMAVGIDVGMVACEVSGLVAKADGQARKWANGYILGAVALSAVLNAFASAEHANGAWIAYLVGGVIPLGVFVLGKVSGHLWTE